MGIDPLKQLALEFEGLQDTIEEYDDSCYAAHMMRELKSAIGRLDEESILYCLQEIKTWYGDELQNIYHGDQAYNFEEHKRYFNIICKLIKELKDYKFPDSNMKRNEKNQNATQHLPEPHQGTPMIFLSHCSSDKAYGDALAEFIVGLGVKRDQLIYSSSPLHKIPMGQNIYEYLRKNINRNIFMIFLWSDEYLDSPACMNEMGAAWVTQCNYTNIYTPTFSFGNPKYHRCAVDTSKMGAVLKNDTFCRTSMIELKNQIQELFGLKNDEVNVAVLLDKFMKKIEEASLNG